ncbi:MAG: ROK family protein [Treponema sp.]|nr:ROK family protein [Treponema sp.]
MYIVTGQGGNLPLIKEQNKFLIREVIYKFSPISRIQIAESLALTPSTITTNVNELLNKKLIRECVKEEPCGESKILGRHPVNLEYDPGARYFIGVDIGPYTTTFVLTDLMGNMVSRQKGPAQSGTYQQLIPFLTGNISKLLEKSSIKPEKVMGAGIGVPASVDDNNGTILMSSRSDWSGKPMAADIFTKTGLETVIENNVKARITAADLFNRNLKADIFLYYRISSGMSCPMVIRKNKLGTRVIGSSEIGHMIVERNGKSSKQKPLILHYAASEQAICGHCERAIKNNRARILAGLCSVPGKPSINEVLEAQRAGDRDTDKIMSGAIMYLGLNLVNLINFVHPEGVLIEAFIMTLPKNKNLMLEIINSNLYNYESSAPVIEFVPYNEHIGALGGAAVAIKHFLLEG